MENIITIKNLTVAYDKNTILKDVNLKVPEGVLMAIIGPNGAGKSTLLKAILNLLKPVDGRIEFSIGGITDPKEALCKVAYIPQNGSVNWDFPATVLDIVLMGRYGHLGWFRRPSSQDKQLAKEMLARVGMETYENHQISELSGGQQQRVFLARALIQESEVYLLDEPFKGIDATAEKIIVRLLKELQAQGKTIVVVHHALHTVSEYFDYVAFINRGLIADGEVDHIFTDDMIKKTFLSLGGSYE